MTLSPNDQISLHRSFLPLGQEPALRDALCRAGVEGAADPDTAIEVGSLQFKAYKRASARNQAHARVLYRLHAKCGSASGTEAILHGWARLQGADQPSSAPIRMSMGELDLHLWRFPEDAALPGLSEVFGLSCSGHHQPPEVMSYRPGERAVLRFAPCGAAPVTYAKTYRSMELCRQVYDRSRRIHIRLGDDDRVGSAEPLAIDTSTATVWHRGAEGSALPQTLGDTCDEALVHDIVRTLVCLHELMHPTLPRAHAKDLLGDAAKKVARLGWVRPELHAEFKALAEALNGALTNDAFRSQEARQVSLHGDFHLRQWLRGKDGLTLCDFDELCIGAPETDIASLLMDLSLYNLSPGTLQAWIAGIAASYASVAPRNLDAGTLRWHLQVQTINKMHRAYVQLHPDLTGECRRYIAHLATVLHHLDMP